MSIKNDFFSECGELETITQLQISVRAVAKDHRFDSVYFRGQADQAWGLRPSIARKHTYADLEIKGFNTTRERYLLHRFRRHARALYERDLPEWEALLLARHHGLPVRLLDWTSNPLVGLYYACVEQNKLQIDGAIWVLVRCQHPHKFFYDIYGDKAGPFKIRGVKMIFAPYVSPRFLAQASHFTIQQYPDKELQSYRPRSFPRKDFDIERIEKWIIPHKSKIPFLKELERFGISERSLFPDLDGIARGILRSEIIRMGKQQQ